MKPSRKRKRGSLRSSEPNLGRQEPSAADLLRFSARFFPIVQPLSAYISLINAHLPQGVAPIALVAPDVDSEHRSYIRLTERALIAWPGTSSGPDGPEAGVPSVPEGVAEGLTGRPGRISYDDVIASVILRTLKKYPNGYDAQANNALCNGFALARPDGPGSVFRDLDSRAPSGAVNMLRSPPWRRLMQRIGHVAVRHLLSNAILLVPVVSEAPSPGAAPTVSLIQLCGPIPKKPLAGKDQRSPASVSLKQDVLYHGHVRTVVSDKSYPMGRQNGSFSGDAGLVNSGLPSSHSMQFINPSDGAQASRNLFHIVFPSMSPRVRREELRRKRRRLDLQNGVEGSARDPNAAPIDRYIPFRMRPVLPLLADIVSRTSKRSFRCVLADACPLSVDDNPRRTKKPRTVKELVALQTKPWQVVSFIVRSLRQVIPLRLFGSLHNRHLFESSVHTLLRERTQFELFDGDHFFAQRGPKVTDVPWLYCPGSNGRKVRNPEDLRFRRDRLRELFIWLWREFCLPLLRHNFYVSESESSRHRVVYFRREVWVAITDATYRVMLKSDRRQFDNLSASALGVSMRQRWKVIASLGSSFCPFPVFLYADIRFLPKASGARGIQRSRGKPFRGFHAAPDSHCVVAIRSKLARMSTAQVVNKAKYSMKLFYTNALEVLRSESRARREALGASVFSCNDIYTKYAQMVGQWRAQGRPPMYFACMDITRSFDTVPLRPLVGTLIPAILTRERYIILRYVVMKRSLSSSDLICRFRFYVCQEPGEESHFPRLVRNKLGPLHPGALFIDLVNITVVSRNELLAALREVLLNNIVAVPRRVRRRTVTAYAIQCQGLPQGSQLSSILTSLFYGSVERSDLGAFLHPCDSPKLDAYLDTGRSVPLQLFMRQVDDTLYASSDRSKAQEFVKRMARGWDDTHGYTVNPSKTRSNFEAAVGGMTAMRFIPWCGYIFDTKSLQVRGDYDRLVSGNVRVRNTLSIDFGPDRLAAFRRKAWACFMPKLHPILLDGSINSALTVALNLYQAAAFATLKLCSYAREMFPAKLNRGDPVTCNFFLSITEQMVQNFCTLALAATKSVAKRTNRQLPIPHRDICYVVCRAVRDVICRRLDIWYTRQTLASLDRRLEASRFTDGMNVYDLELRYASVVRPSSSPSIWKIRL